MFVDFRLILERQFAHYLHIKAVDRCLEACRQRKSIMKRLHRIGKNKSEAEVEKLIVELDSDYQVTQ